MKNEKEEFEEKIIEGKKVRIKIIKQLHGAWAGLNGKTITLNEKTKNTLNEKGLDSILSHEVGHFKFINQLLIWLPIILIFGAIVYFFINYVKIIITLLFFNLPIIYTLVFLILIIFGLFIFGTIIELPIAWTKEILCDWNAVKNTNGDIFRKTLQEFYKYNKKNSKPSIRRFYNGVVLHPPQPIRLKIIKYIEKLRDKNSSLNLKNDSPKPTHKVYKEE